MNGQGNIADVLAGKESIKVDIGIDAKSAIIGGLALFIAGLLLVIVSKKI